MSEWTPPEGQTFQPSAHSQSPPVEEPMADASAEWTPPANNVWHPGRAPVAKPRVVDHKEAGTGLIPAWSASRLKDYDTCPHRLRLRNVDKVETPEHPAAARGTAIHTLAERFVDGTWGTMDDDLARFIPDWNDKIFPKFKDAFEMLQERYAEGKVELEGEWAFDKDWGITDWKAPDAWCRMKLDALYWESDTSALVIDYKTGKKFGNEISHAQQGMIYAVGTFLRYEQLEFIEVAFWYLDHNDTTKQRYSREQAMQFLPRITDRATIMTTDTELAPKPSPSNCKFCDFAKNESCEWRYSL